MESTYSTVSSFTNGNATAAAVNEINDDVGNPFEAASGKMIEGDDHQGRVMIRGDAASNCYKPDNIEPPLRNFPGLLDPSGRWNEGFAGEYVSQDTTLCPTDNTMFSVSRRVMAETDEQQTDEYPNVDVFPNDDTPVEDLNGSAPRNGVRPWKTTELWCYKDGGCMSRQDVEPTTIEMDKAKCVTDETERTLNTEMNGNAAAGNFGMDAIGTPSVPFENESIGETLGTPQVATEVTSDQDNMVLSVCAVNGPCERDVPMGPPSRADLDPPNGISSDAFAECNSNMKLDLDPTCGLEDDSFGEFPTVEKDCTHVATPQTGDNVSDYYCGDNHDEENGFSVNVNTYAIYCNGTRDELEKIGRERPLDDNGIEPVGETLAEEVCDAGFVAQTKNDNNHGQDNTQEDEVFNSFEAVENNNEVFGSFEAVEINNESEEDEFGEFDEANVGSDILDDEFGEFDDGGAGSSMVADTTGGFMDDGDDDVAGPSYAEKPKQNLAMNLNTADPILAKVHTVFAKLFPRPCKSADAVDDDSSERETLETLLKGLNAGLSEEPTSFDLSALKSRLNEYQSTRRRNDTENNNIAIFGHDRNPYISTLKASDSRTVKYGGFSIGWSQSEREESESLSDADIDREVERLAKLIPDLSYMLSEPKQP